MGQDKSALHERIQSGKSLLLAELLPPCGSDPSSLRDEAKQFVGKVHALVISDNRDRVRMSAVAAASVVTGQGVEPILCVVTRDRNRIALVSDCLGAQALGFRNVLCTTGTHQTLGRPRMAKNVFDVDSIHLLKTYSRLSMDGSIVGEERVNSAGPLCLGAVANPYADPMEMQLIRLSKKVSAGAQFLITQPVFDLERFVAWWGEVTGRGLHKKAAIVAGIQVLGDGQSAAAFARRRPSPCVPEAVLNRIASKGDSGAQRAEAVDIASETVKRLSELAGLRGFQIRDEGDTDTALEILDKSGLTTG
jgi:methylenetetrahydrofolate reductase (NADPH)